MISLVVRGLVIGMAALALACSAAPPASVVTPLQPTACMTADAAVRAEFARRNLGVTECPGVKPWRVLFVSSDENSWIELRTPGGRWSSEDDVVYRGRVGNFPRVADGTPLEWRVTPGASPTAVIFRVVGQKPDDPTMPVSVFYVARLEHDRACVLGRESSVDAARAVADGPRTCASTESR